MASTGPPPRPAHRLADSVLYHGVAVPDPYRWLEDGEAPPVIEWVAQQNQRTRQALDARPDRSRWHERLVELMGVPVVQQAKQRGDRLFSVERAAGAEQFALVLRSVTDRTAEPVPLVDPTAGGSDATTALDWFHPSSDGRLVAYGLSHGGTENSTLFVIDVESAEHLADQIEHTRAATVAWLPDSSGFYYAGYPPGDQYNRRILQHTLGANPADDPVVWSDPSTPQSWPEVHLSADGRYLLVDVMVGWDRIDAFMLDRRANEWTVLVEGVEALSTFDFAGDHLVIATTEGAPRGRVALARLDDPTVAKWRTVVGERAGVITRAVASGEELLVLVTEGAVDRLERWSMGGEPLGACGELGPVSIGSIAADVESTAAFFTVTGFDAPSRLIRYEDGALEEWVAPRPGDSGIPSLVVSQETYPSLDGTEIGIFIVHRRDVVPSSATPAILSGYGGFAISETPVWSPLVAAWCEAGGLYAVAGLRGGLEHGEAWHQAGRRGTKQNVFDDFHAGGDWLVESGRTSRHRLAIAGGSNGGLLVGVALTQRPDLCRVVWCAVPLLDMVRFPHFLIARLWTDEYGDPDVAEEFGWLWAYSPYHHVEVGQTYPAVLLTTAEGDGRVDPMHARKMAAELQFAAARQEERPVLLFQEGKAGHGAGKPAGKRADESADVLAFFAWQLGVAP